MKTPHEWPQPPSSIKSSSMRRKLTCETLASVDWYKSRRYESYSDGDDELCTREPLEAACQSSGDGIGIQSSGYGDLKGFQSYGYGKEKGIQSSHKGLESAGYGNCKGFRSSGQGFDTHANSTKISSNKEGKAKFPVVPQQPLRLNALPFSGPLKPAGKPHMARLVIPAHATGEEKTFFDTREPFSPKVTCLGRVRIKEKQANDTEHSRPEQRICGDAQRHTLESKKKSVEKNHKDGTHKGSREEKRCCLPRRKRREDTDLGTLKLFGSSSSAAVPLETTETRRERAALLARTLTSLLEDLRRLDMENPVYIPAVPPPNSLLLMRGLNKSQEVSTENTFQSEENNSTINENACKDSAANGIPLQDIKMWKIMKLAARVDNSNEVAHATAQKGFPLSELESNSLVQNASSFEMNNKRPMGDCHQELALWQRRAIAKLAAIDTKRPMRMEIKQPSTK